MVGWWHVIEAERYDEGKIGLNAGNRGMEPSADWWLAVRGRESPDPTGSVEEGAE